VLHRGLLFGFAASVTSEARADVDDRMLLRRVDVSGEYFEPESRDLRREIAAAGIHDVLALVVVDPVLHAHTVPDACPRMCAIGRTWRVRRARSEELRDHEPRASSPRATPKADASLPMRGVAELRGRRRSRRSPRTTCERLSVDGTGAPSQGARRSAGHSRLRGGLRVRTEPRADRETKRRVIEFGIRRRGGL
jgi:hypothetical protein